MSITKLEQETIIFFNEAEAEAEAVAEVYTHNARLKKRLVELHEKRPEEVKQTSGKGQSVTYTIPKTWVRINPAQILSEEQKRKRAARLNRPILP